MPDAKEAPPETKKKSGLMKYIILVVLLLVLAGGGYFAYLKFFAKPPAAEVPGEAKTEEAAPKAEEKPAPKEEKKAESGHGEAAKGGHGEKGKDKAPSNNVSLPAFVVNLADPNARRYLKLVIEVEMTSDPDSLEANKAKIRDSLLLLLSSKTSQDLTTLEGKITLRKEIVDRINQALGQAKVARVYFTDFVIQ